MFILLLLAFLLLGGVAAGLVFGLKKTLPQIQWIAPGAAVLVFLMMFLGLYVKKQGVITERRNKEAALSSQYPDNQNYLSDCIIKTNQAADVAVANTKAVDTVMSDAIKGRYG